MYVDLLNSNNYISINISLIQLIGLNGAVYLSEVLNIFKKAVIKNKLIDEVYVKIDRKFIKSRTTISEEEQKIIDAKLSKLNLISLYINKNGVIDDNTISIDVSGIVALIAESNNKEEKETLDAIKETFKTKTKGELDTLKLTAISKNLKKSISTSNVKIRRALEQWIDTLVSSTSISKTMVIQFQEGIYKYSSNNNVVLRLIEIATINKYQYSETAISKYEQLNKIEENKPRCTPQVRATRLGNLKF